MRTSWLTPEQIQLRYMLNRMHEKGPVSAEQLAELGVFGATLPEEYGGLGFGITEATVIAEALGRARNTAPYLETAIIAGDLIARLGSDAQRGRWLPRIADGSLKVALAFPEKLHFNLFSPAMTARRTGDGFALDGVKEPVAWAGEADLVLLNARSENGLSLFLLEAGDLPFSESYGTVDDLPAASLHLSQHAVPAESLLGPEGRAADALDEVLHRARIVLAAEQTGLMAHLINVTIDYLKQRRQFGSALADFQVLRHRVADMMLAYEKAASMMVRARLAGDGPLDDLRRRAALGAALIAKKSARYVGHEAIQLHGGMGVTEELSVGPTVKRIYALETRLGPIEPAVADHACSIYGG